MHEKRRRKEIPHSKIREKQEKKKKLKYERKKIDDY